jgi:hypothetical protein
MLVGHIKNKTINQETIILTNNLSNYYKIYKRILQ